MCSVQTCYFLTSSAGHTPTWTTKSQSYVETWPQWCHPTSADFFFFFWPCSITSFLSVWLCIWELQKPHTSSCNSESPTLRPHSWQPGQPNWLCPVHHLWFTQSWIENIAGRRNFFYYKNLEIKMVFFFFFPPPPSTTWQWEVQPLLGHRSAEWVWGTCGKCLFGLLAFSFPFFDFGIFVFIMHQRTKCQKSPLNEIYYYPPYFSQKEWAQPFVTLMWMASGVICFHYL